MSPNGGIRPRLHHTGATGRPNGVHLYANAIKWCALHLIL
ncbi:hypothetical protein EDWATA_03109 [Edwardsiella tarda ATCC 23685]|uniref:Uncharacterized protein n=1 Tax=Edwardsiella tarda ATCC 23685 TaxID=500638 RepID=D4F8K9_EDWTA|nr:hypothetical protein EDWATA_03109 [Edwardsiella tarda ATCC 23685]